MRTVTQIKIEKDFPILSLDISGSECDSPRY